MVSVTDLFISNAWAEGAAPAAEPGGFVQFLPLIVLVVVFYLLILRPQQKRAKELSAMLDALQKGDEVVTIGGVIGRITKLTDSYASIEVADSTVLQVQRTAIQSLLPKGTIKSI
ncbi:MAG: preprotein translocase subunit YajC [Nitrosomonadales bacterium]|nr:preprotein translocase subunit YajC [Nitrosomonadales bacterium]